ncbi:hypothetical protein [Roseinatronobacter ekhonensis]|uniref:hypothetical protein n=1 Tax=Roseinatronobacter ekhonensis TaxID=254356 RepID=UPI0016008394|nr:hypothetical protein [Roseibaca ekhonensis]
MAKTTVFDHVRLGKAYLSVEGLPTKRSSGLRPNYMFSVLQRKSGLRKLMGPSASIDQA